MQDREAGSAWRAFWRFAPILVIGAVLLAGYALGWHEGLTLSALAESRALLRAKVDAHPLLAAALFSLFYAAAVAAAFPAASLLTVAAGFLFGWLSGGLLVVFSATLGATLLFLAARSAFGDVLRRRGGNRIERLARGFEGGAFGYLLVLRLAPIFPFWLVNIAPALFKVRLATYVSATALGILPASFAYAYLGSGLDSVLDAAAASGGTLELADLATPEITTALIALAVVAVLAVAVKGFWTGRAATGGGQRDDKDS